MDLDLCAVQASLRELVLECVLICLWVIKEQGKHFYGRELMACLACKQDSVEFAVKGKPWAALGLHAHALPGQ